MPDNTLTGPTDALPTRASGAYLPDILPSQSITDDLRDIFVSGFLRSSGGNARRCRAMKLLPLYSLVELSQFFSLPGPGKVARSKLQRAVRKARLQFRRLANDFHGFNNLESVDLLDDIGMTPIFQHSADI